VKSIVSLVAAASILVVEIATAKCATMSIRDRFLEAQTVVLVEILDARDGPVPLPYGLGTGSMPGRLLTLRVLKSWKGSVHPGDVISSWTGAAHVEDAYLQTSPGSQILVFYWKQSSHEISACNTASPLRLNETSERLDAIVRNQSSSVDPNQRLERP
jgi:hypothetical protein